VSITGLIPGPGGVVVTAIGRACFYCHQPTSDPAVAWAGADGLIVVHADCVEPWHVRLARDVHEIENPGYYARRFRGRE
jgi:hypothetical protein